MSFSKPDHEDLAEATGDYLSSYIGDGVSIESYIQNLDPAINVENLSELLKYYFLLTGSIASSEVTDRSSIDVTLDDTGGITLPSGEPVGVLDFVSLLPSRLRTVDPATRQQVQIFENEVRGRVDWNHTIKDRYRTGEPHGQRYACRVRQRTVLTDKNRVLATLLATIKDTLTTFRQKHDAPGSVEWFSEWGSNSTVREIFEEELNNVYLSQFDLDSVSVDDRTLKAVREARDPLYREAATLLLNYRRIMREDLQPREMKELLKLNPFGPSDDNSSDLYELYWTFELLDQFDDPQFKQIDLETDLVAAWEENGSEYRLYHDWTGEGHEALIDDYRDYLQIMIPDAPLQDQSFEDSGVAPVLKRQYSAFQQSRRIGESVFNFGYTSRKEPDIVLLELTGDEPEKELENIFIGEVKWSTDNNYLKSGLQQLLEYGTHAKFGPHLDGSNHHGTEFVANNFDVLSSPGIELGYFVGHKDLLDEKPPEGLQVCGFGDIPTRPFTAD